MPIFGGLASEKLRGERWVSQGPHPEKKKTPWKFPRAGSKELGNFPNPLQVPFGVFGSSEGTFFFWEKNWTWKIEVTNQHGKFIGLKIPLPSKISSQKITLGIDFIYRALNHTS